MDPKYVDIHSHVNFSAFDQDRAEVVERALAAGTWMINVGTQQDTSRSAIELAERYEEGVYAIVGLHPIHTSASYHDAKELGEGGKAFTSRGESFEPAAYRDMLAHPKVVGIGECGLDYYRTEPDSIERQRQAFVGQIRLANEAGKPLMLHIRSGSGRSAYRDAADILREEGGARGDVHFFAGSWEEAKLFLDLGFTLSFTGVITFARDYDEVIRNAPLDMLMTETDCPYVTPAPHRGKRNEPLYVSEVARKVAEIKNIAPETASEQLVANARRVFGI